ncbi:MAG: hypothetical protein ACLU37_08975 [Collinsella sp.]
MAALFSNTYMGISPRYLFPAFPDVLGASSIAAIVRTTAYNGEHAPIRKLTGRKAANNDGPSDPDTIAATEAGNRG